MSSLRVSATAVPIPHAWEAAGRPLEAPLRVSALALSAGKPFCFLTSDTLEVPADIYEEVARRLETEAGVSPDRILLCATHSHHAPSTIDHLGMRRDRDFCASLQETLVRAALDALRGLDSSQSGCRLLFAESQEATVGMNSRYLLKDGTIAWYAYAWEDVIRPTGPYDPDLPVLAAVAPSGETRAVLFSHSVHNIGTLSRETYSPGTYGLAAQELERQHQGVTLFLPGAFGSTHYTGGFGATPLPYALTTAERVYRIVEAVKEGLDRAEAMDVDAIQALRRPFTYRLRTFDEAKEAATVQRWAEKYTPREAASHCRAFAEMRREMAPVQGEERQTWLHAIRLGDIALVGIPGELFAHLELAIRRRSPFRHTYVIGLANGTIGYIGDRKAYELGGYQLWAGWHSRSEPGTGEAMVDQAVAMLEELAA